MRRRVVTWLVGLVLAWVAYRAVVRLVGAVDWSAVGSALVGLDAWLFAPLVALLLVRQVLNAVPLTYYAPGLGLARSVQNDTVANLLGTFAPPPADVVVRVQMFRSWGLDPVVGMTGVSLNSAKFYVIRFIAPVLGLLALGVREAELRQWLVALASFLASGADLAGFIADVVATADAVGARRRSARRIRLSLDEWNVWYMTRFPPSGQRSIDPPGTPRIEDTYSTLDAVVVGDLLITLINNADRVAIGCLAQLVNVIAPIRTEPGGAAWRQTIFHPLAATARAAEEGGHGVRASARSARRHLAPPSLGGSLAGAFLANVFT